MAFQSLGLAGSFGSATLAVKECSWEQKSSAAVVLEGCDAVGDVGVGLAGALTVEPDVGFAVVRDVDSWFGFDVDCDVGEFAAACDFPWLHDASIIAMATARTVARARM